MKYFFGAVILIVFSLLLTGDVVNHPSGLPQSEPIIFHEIACENNQITCVESITFPAMHINVEKD